MHRILYGSSNVYRHFARSTLSADHQLSLVQCTKKTVFDAHVASLGTLATGSVVVTSVLENFVVEVCRDLEETEVGLFANQQITAHVEALANLARDAPDSCVCISPLLVRLTPSKFSPFRFYEEKRTSISYVLLLLFLSCILQR